MWKNRTHWLLREESGPTNEVGGAIRALETALEKSELASNWVGEFLCEKMRLWEGVTKYSLEGILAISSRFNKVTSLPVFRLSHSKNSCPF